MRALLLLAVLAALAAAAPAAVAGAAPVVGISDSNPIMFDDPSFAATRISTTRLMIAYDTVEAATRGDTELDGRVVPYLAAAAAARVQPLVTFEHSRGSWTECRAAPRLRQCRLPGGTEYHDAVRAFLERFPQVTHVSPWNEANHPAQPTARAPKMAARYANIVAGVCRELRRRCTIVVADVLDAADRADARRLTFRRTTRWIRRFRAALKIPRRVCGIHNYSDVNRFRADGTKALMRALGCREYWITESGGLFRFGQFWDEALRRTAGCRSRAACQLKATRHLFAITGRMRRVKRIYVHSWYAGRRDRFDAGIVSGWRTDWMALPRPAFYVVRDHAWDGPVVRVPAPPGPPPPPEEPVFEWPPDALFEGLPDDQAPPIADAPPEPESEPAPAPAP
ncbi:MAG TPA: hypothetical protein VF533_10705 [Solirubrobacteraceae bacterium]|jgi:hypothetical protein